MFRRTTGFECGVGFVFRGRGAVSSTDIGAFPFVVVDGWAFFAFGEWWGLGSRFL